MEDSRRCTAKSKRSQQRCKKPAMIGGHVCEIHGGKTPIALINARTRIQEMVDPALTQLLRLVDATDISEHVRYAAIKDVLDRAGYKPSTQVDVTVTRDMMEAEYERLIADAQP